MRLAQQRWRCSSNTRPHNPGSYNPGHNAGSSNLGRRAGSRAGESANTGAARSCSIPGPGEAGHSIPGAVEHAPGPPAKLSSVRSCAPGPSSSTPASWPPSRGRRQSCSITRELLDYADPGPKLPGRACGVVARELSSVPGVWHKGAASCRGRPGSCRQLSNQGHRELIEAAGVPALWHREQANRARCMAQCPLSWPGGQGLGAGEAAELLDRGRFCAGCVAQGPHRGLVKLIERAAGPGKLRRLSSEAGQSSTGAPARSC